jgi:hypothetical protein
MKARTPPYRCEAATMLSPDSASAVSARSCADCPDAVATAATPPSSAATRFSNTSYVDMQLVSTQNRLPEEKARTTVGFPIRE